LSFAIPVLGVEYQPALKAFIFLKQLFSDLSSLSDFSLADGSSNWRRFASYK
jgi:hypothetical protein